MDTGQTQGDAWGRRDAGEAGEARGQDAGAAGASALVCPEEALLNAAFALDCLARRSSGPRPEGLTKAQVDLIVRISLLGPASMTALSRELALSKEHVTRAVSSLEERGLLAKRREAGNHRVVVATLTEAGAGVAMRIRTQAAAGLAGPLSTLEPAKREELLELADRLAHLAREVRMG